MRIIQNVGLLHAVPYKTLLKADARKMSVKKTSKDSQILVQAAGAVARAVALKIVRPEGAGKKMRFLVALTMC
jgi:hypothetical protein